jgi:ATP-dependent exoDNAse (exonuclease V) beta subunit (contains helicase and exonuclease domains)
MFGWGKKKPERGEPGLDTFAETIKALLAQDSFISRKEYRPIIDKATDQIANCETLIKEGVFEDWCKKREISKEKTLDDIKIYRDIASLVKTHNDDFTERHLTQDKAYLDDVLKDVDPTISLDQEQRTAVLRDEDHTLIIAGAGAGKTTTIAAKVKYLVDKRNVDPSRILVVSFTNKATEELRDRINRKLKINANISTFHSIGYSIIKGNDNVKRRVVDDGYMFDVVNQYLQGQLDNEDNMKKILLFFASYLTPPFNEKNTATFHKMLATNDFTTLKSDLNLQEAITAYKNKLAESNVSMKEERCNSNQEVQIANFLYINGIDYEYEPVYPYRFMDSIKPYTPDFLLSQGDKKVYLEHFGITEDGKSDRFKPEELELYKRHINDKIKLHRKHGTHLIYTFSSYNDGRSFIEHLEEILRKEGFVFDRRADHEIYSRIIKSSEDKYFTKLVQLIDTFIERFQVNNFGDGKFNVWSAGAKDERTKLFLEIAYRCYLEYQRKMEENKYIDFDGMINKATDVLNSYIKSGTKLPYDYVFIDEYQDISLQRYDLAEKISKASDAKIIAVGDDWQSIFRFAGAKVSLFTNFEKMVGYADMLKITNTYRNSQELIDIAGNFVMENTEQIQKNLHSPKHCDDPVILITYDDSYEKDEQKHGPLYRLCQGLEKAIDEIVMASGESKKILVIGRYGFDGKNLNRFPELFLFEKTKERNKVVSLKHPHVVIDFLTAHSAKGLGYDNVIIINARDAQMGFPSKIEDDPVMKLVIGNDEKIDYADERRLFYVAMTRTKNRVYIITPEYHPSKFVLEIKEHNTHIVLKGQPLSPEENNEYRYKCPKCRYPLQLRQSKILNQKLYICTNDPEICGYVTNDTRSGRMSISKCPKCESGYLIYKTYKTSTGKEMGFMACTNYKPDGTGCDYIMRPEGFTQNLEILEMTGRKTYESATEIAYCGLPMKDLLVLVYSAVNSVKEEKPYFGFNIGVLAWFLMGEEKDCLTKTGVNTNKFYGRLRGQSQGKIMGVIEAMVSAEIFHEIQDGQYQYVLPVPQEIGEEQCQKVFEAIQTKFQKR